MKIPAGIDGGSISPTTYVNKFSSPIQKCNHRVQQAQRDTHEGGCNVINLDISTWVEKSWKMKKNLCLEESGKEKIMREYK